MGKNSTFSGNSFSIISFVFLLRLIDGQYIQHSSDIIAGAKKYQLIHALYRLLDNWMKIAAT